MKSQHSVFYLLELVGLFQVVFIEILYFHLELKFSKTFYVTGSLLSIASAALNWRWRLSICRVFAAPVLMVVPFFSLLPLLSQNLSSVEQIVTPPTDTQGLTRLAALKSLPSNSLPPELLGLWCVYCRRPFIGVFIKTWSCLMGCSGEPFFVDSSHGYIKATHLY